MVIKIERRNGFFYFLDYSEFRDISYGKYYLVINWKSLEDFSLGIVRV